MIRIGGIDTMRRGAFFALWLAAASVTPFAAVRLGIFPMIALFATFIFAARDFGWAWRALARRRKVRVAKSLVGHGRISLCIEHATTNALVSILTGFGAWLVPFFLGAYAIKNPAGGAYATAFVSLGVSAICFARVVLSKERRTIVIGVDGVRIDDAFVPYTSIQSTTSSGDGFRVTVATETGEKQIELPLALGEELVRAIESRRTKPVESHEVAYREASDPLAHLRDPSQSMEARLRIAESVAPEELDRLIDDTANPDLAEALAKIRAR